VIGEPAGSVKREIEQLRSATSALQEGDRPGVIVQKRTDVRPEEEGEEATSLACAVSAVLQCAANTRGMTRCGPIKLVR
jgi:hypothetical protein